MISASKVLESKGISLRVIGEDLSLSPKEKVTPEVVQFAKAHKKEIIEEIQSSIIYQNPYPPGTKEARTESLLQVMDAIYQTSLKKVQRDYEWSELIPDQRLEAVRQAVLKSQAKLKDFQTAADEWAKKAILN